MHTDTTKNEISNDMQHILDHLKKKDKEIFMKHYVEEDSVKKIVLTPVLTSGEEGEKKTNYRKVLTEEEFEVVIKE